MSNVLVTTDFGPLIVNSNDYGVGRQLMKTGSYCSSDINLMKQLIHFLIQQRGECLIYDVGSNIGTHSVALAKSSVLVSLRSFEAQRQIFYCLCGNIALNKLENVICHNNAVSDISGEQLQFRTPNYGSENNFGGLELRPPSAVSDNASMIFGGEEIVTTLSLDSFNEMPGFIKLDIEGMELSALYGAQRIVKEARPIMWIEILKSNMDDIQRFLVKFGYRGYILKDDLIAIPDCYNVKPNETRVIF